MAITQNDLEILESEIMADTDDGGGLPTGIAVVDGVSNNLFPDVSDIDRLIGRVRLRKISLAIKTANADLLQAPRLLFTELPDNPNISVFVFKATSFADRRSDAQNKIESYLAPGSKWAGHLLETQLAGQRVIQVSLNETDQMPKSGQPLVLIQNEGQSDEFYQYIRPDQISAVARTFPRTATESVRRIVVTVSFDEPLYRTFEGLTVPEFYQNISTVRRAVLREARVSDAAKYYSASRLAEPVVAMTTKQVKLESIYTQIVPSTLTETALPLLNPIGQSKTLVQASDGTVSISKSVSVRPNTPWQLGSSIYPSSLSLVVGGITMSDSDGELKNGANIYASIDYDLGVITWYDTANIGVVTVIGSYTPAAALMRVMQSEVQYTPEINAGTSYLRTLQVKPTKGSLQVSFQVSGKVIYVRDDGKGNLISGADSQAYGIIDYENKIVQLALPAIPDSNSAIIYGYATDMGVVASGGKTTRGYFEFAVPEYMPHDLTISWGNNKSAKIPSTPSDNAVLKFNGSTLIIEPDEIPPVGTVFTASYNQPVDATQIISGKDVVVSNSAVSDNTFLFDIGAFDSGTLNGELLLSWGTWQTSTLIDVGQMPTFRVTLADNGNGSLLVSNVRTRVVDQIPVDNVHISVVYSTINYTSGVGSVTLRVSATKTVVTTEISAAPDANGVRGVAFITTQVPLLAKLDRLLFTYSAKKWATTTEAKTQVFTATKLSLDVPTSVTAPVIPNSLKTMGYADLAGQMVNEQGDVVGAIDYGSANVALSDWRISPNPIVIDSAAQEYFVPPVSSIVFRTQSAPLKPESLTVSVEVDEPKSLAAVRFDVDGAVTGDSGNVRGFVDYKAGVVGLYHDKLHPDTLLYTAMSYSYLPLDKELIGLDPVRLPTDGRVPFVRKGDSIAITELKTMQLPTNAANDSFNLGFERLSDVNVVDSTGKKVSFDYLDIDLDAGILTLNDTYLPSEYTAPLTAKYRIMDIALVIDTDISGRVTLSTPITHDYSTAAVFSSMLLAGDMQARAFNVFGQKSWTGIFSDTLIGDATTSQLQVTNNPIVITNRDAITERWALVFTSQTAFNIIGQTVGQIGSGSTLETTAPINPMTGYPYFTIPLQAWGIGWAANNVVRINTDSAKYPVWIGNAIQQHQGSSTDNYDFTIGYHANIDRDRVVA